MKIQFSFVIILFLFSSCATNLGVDHSRQGLFERLSEIPVARNYRENEIAKDAEFYSWRWPLDRVVVTSHFGKRGRRMHEGIDLKAPVGTPIYAAQKGRVVYSGQRIRGYGKMVVIEHKAGIYSVYAHNNRNFVRKGQWVDQSQKIALSGRSGRVTGPHLHFEIRRGTKSINPALALGKNKNRKIATKKR